MTYEERRKAYDMISSKIKSTPISPSTFAQLMREIAELNDDDPDRTHRMADDLMCKILTSLGYGEGLEILYSMIRWYA